MALVEVVVTLVEVLARQSKNKGRRLGYILGEMGLVTEQQKIEALGLRLDLRKLREIDKGRFFG